MGGHQIPGMGSGDDGYDEEGYDESQRAEILEATRNGPTDGLILTDLDPDLGGDDAEDEPIDELDMDSEEVGEASAEVDADEDDLDEDDVQDEFDADAVGKDADGDDADDDNLDDADDVALRP
ncbi:DNA primase [Sphingomonas sp.]|uniref:DNA primase n=1 Tax=Sphingomonas sp. TaxID=28214 RepID=UPI0035BC715D